jgi:hypothetical protein
MADGILSYEWLMEYFKAMLIVMFYAFTVQEVMTEVNVLTQLRYLILSVTAGHQ